MNHIIAEAIHEGVETIVNTQEKTTGSGRQQARQRATTEAVTSEDAVRIADLADRFNGSVMTDHRHADENQARGLPSKARGVASPTSTPRGQPRCVVRSSPQLEEKEAISRA